MRQIQQLLTASLLCIIVDQVYTQESRIYQGTQTCGSRLKGPVGIIQTPNFPNPFPVPIKCRWIIEHDIINGTISIYFTQQFTTSGLTFTEYMYYDETYKLGERRALTVTEENITKIKWLQVQSPILVIELTLSQLEGTQLRALGLLSVFGFNMTYVVKAPNDAPGPTSCSAIECRLLGHCYVQHNYEEFFCSCFEGYSGVDCGTGPLCPKVPNMCQNGGTCRQMGPAAVSCICAPGYTGDLCESEIATPECGIEECSGACKQGNACDCNPKETDFSSARFDTQIQIVGENDANISKEIVKYVTDYLKTSNITIYDEIEFINMSKSNEDGVSNVWLRIWGARREANLLRATLTSINAVRVRSTSLRLLPSTLPFEMQPALSLHSLIVNQRPEVWEGSEFILTCMAYGSPNIVFTWYKDGTRINFNGTIRDIWTRIVAEDALGRRMSVLGISEAKKQDSGRWSCTADDGGRRRCSALRLTILRPPEVLLIPTSLAVNKGDNVSITCLAGAGKVHGILGFSWARERNLMALAPGREVWEDLYPAGSVLKLYNVQKSSEFRCQVSSMAGMNAKSVTLWTLNSKDEACTTEASHGLRWPKTAPGAHASTACPAGYTGEATRFCEPKTNQHGTKWRLPDFTDCLADSLRDIYEQFTSIYYGYSWNNVSYVVHQYGSVLRSLPMHPGEGSLPLQHAKTMLHYLLSIAGTPEDRMESVKPLLMVYDTLFKYPDAFLDEEKIFELQNAVVDTAAMKNKLDENYHGFNVKTKLLCNKAVNFDFVSEPGSAEWLFSSIEIGPLKNNDNISVVAVQYYVLPERLPSLRRSIEFKNGRELQFSLASEHLQVAIRGVHHNIPHYITLHLAHSNNYSVHASKLACGLRTSSEPRIWNTKACEVQVSEGMRVICRCQGFGTYALFTVARSIFTDTERDLKEVVKITVSFGGTLCLVTAVLQILRIITTDKPRLLGILKATTAGAHSAAVFTLLECDTAQVETCPGLLGWLCAACWCAGCAALCAQPLLLQAELAGRSQAASSVGLLAGVCTLVWLTARLWGGSPLQLGSAAQFVCATGCVLLTLLCFSLTLCAAIRLRTITHKVPVERRTYLQERGRVVCHTLVLMITTSVVQAAGVAYVQSGPSRLTYVTAFSSAALANGIATFICYVIYDEECSRSVRKLLSFSIHREGHNSPVGDTSHSRSIH